MLKVAVAGCGWLGLPLAISLIKKGNSVIGSTTSENKLVILKELGIQGKIWTLSDSSSKESSTFFNGVDVLVINIPTRKKEESVQYSKAISHLCSNLSETIRVLFVSTTSVYPDSLKNATEEYIWSEGDLINETVKTEIELTKLLGSRLTILRLAGLIGPNRHPIHFLSGRTDIPNGNSPVNLIHLNDVIGIIEKIILQNYWGEIINGCYPLHPTREEYYKKSAEYFHLSIPSFCTGTSISKTVSSEKSQKKLDYLYSTSIFEFS